MFSFVNGYKLAGGGMVTMSNGSVVSSTTNPHSITFEDTKEFDIFINDEKVHLVRTKKDEHDAAADAAAASSLPVTECSPHKPIRVELRAKETGKVTSVSASVTVQGDVQGSVSTASGDVEVAKNVKHRVETMSGNIDVRGEVGGDVSTMSGDVRVGVLRGSASSMGGNVQGVKRGR